MFIALVLVTSGLAFLGLNVGLIPLGTFRILWPLILVFFGVYLMMGGKGAWHDSLISKKKIKNK